jgi:hypothetical protein
MKKLELILIAGAAVSIILTILNIPLHSMLVSVFLLPLSILYLYLSFALFNNIPFDKIFKSESYKSLDTWNFGIAIGTGLGLSLLTIGFMFTVNNYPMARSLLDIGLVLTAFVLQLVLIRNVKEKRRFNRNIALRCAMFIIIGVVFLLFSGQSGQTS